MKKVEERLSDRSSLVRFAKGIADLGGKGGLPLSLPPSGAGREQVLFENIQTSFTENQAGLKPAGGKKNLAGPQERWERTQMKGLFWTFSLWLY